MNTKTFSFTRQFLLIFALMLFLTNVVLGVVLMKQSTDIIQQLVRKNMLNISNTAADIVDGDVLGALTKEDIGSDEYNEIYNVLSAFQNNVDVEYIYAVRRINDELFVFTVDPDPEDPGEFGEEVLITEALISASKGVAMVDNAPAEDEWGNFYSAYCPVFDSKGNVSGIIGVDFNSDWYDMQIREHTLSIVTITALSIAFGGLIVLIFVHNISKRFDTIGNELTVLSNDVDSLTKEITSRKDYKDNIAKDDRKGDDSDESEGDEIELLEGKLHHMHTEMDRYLDFIRNKANTDALTLVGNTTAYTERVNSIGEKIADKTADFSLVLFDINDLKGINDNYGHHYGDVIIKAAADVISSVFDADNIYRIGGDEFIAVEENIEQKKIDKMIALIHEKVMLYDKNEMEHKGTLALSTGTATYDPEIDKTFRDVFSRADDNMYSDKNEYYKHNKKLKKTR